MHIRIFIITLFSAASLLVMACAEAAVLGSAAGAPTAAASPSINRQSLEGRWNEAITESKGGRSWVTYSFNVRPGVGVDEELPSELKEIISVQGLRISLRPSAASRNVGLFVLQEGGRIERVEIHDLDRYRADAKHPVKSLGRADNAESFALLQSLYAKNAGGEVGERLVLAMAMHDDPQVASLLKGVIAGGAAGEKEKGTAAMWLGQIAGQKEFLESLARDERAPVEVRKQAVVGLGFSHYPGALAALRSIYESAGEREVREQAIFASSNTPDKAAAIAFLKKVKETDPDADFRRQATMWLEHSSGKDNF